MHARGLVLDGLRGRDCFGDDLERLVAYIRRTVLQHDRRDYVAHLRRRRLEIAHHEAGVVRELRLFHLLLYFAEHFCDQAL